LIIDFHINPLKACKLVVARKEAVSIQLEAWRFRQGKPRNPAGWMIQAMESSYALPASYLDHKNKQQEQGERELAKSKIQNCPICDEKGFRYTESIQYPSGAMRQCTHEPISEWSYENSDSKDVSGTKSSPDAQN
jgi:hypothetical protein